MTSINAYKRLNSELVQKNKELKGNVAMMKTEIVRLQKLCQNERDLGIQQKLKFVEALTDSFNLLLQNVAVTSGKKPQFNIQNVLKIFPEIAAKRKTHDAISQTKEQSSGYGLSESGASLERSTYTFRGRSVEKTHEKQADSFSSNSPAFQTFEKQADSFPSTSAVPQDSVGLLSDSIKSNQSKPYTIIDLNDDDFCKSVTSVIDTIIEEDETSTETIVEQSLASRSEIFDHSSMKQVPASTPIKQKRKSGPIVILKRMSKEAVLQQIQRPKRAASPSNLKEANLKRKLRRNDVDAHSSGKENLSRMKGRIKKSSL